MKSLFVPVLPILLARIIHRRRRPSNFAADTIAPVSQLVLSANTATPPPFPQTGMRRVDLAFLQLDRARIASH
jgi:hypothetical protein